jgi:hypothetical protein
MTKYSGTILMGDIRRSINKIAKDHDILDIPLNKLARIFLNDYIDKDCIQIPFQELRESYEARFLNEDPEIERIPLDENEFYEKICASYLFIVSNTDSKLKENIRQIIADLKTIEKTKIKYTKDLELLKKAEFEEGNNYKEKLLIHYINKQRKAENEIISYIKDKLYPQTKLNRYKSFLNHDLFNFKYSYEFYPYSYHIEHLSELRNKLGSLSVTKYFELEKIYRNKRDSFLTELKKVYTAKEIILNIKSCIKKNHRLNQRRDLIFSILDLFLKNKFQLFCNIVPQQVEGIIYDYSLEFGIDDKSLLNSTLVDKVNQLAEKGDKNVDYEYFAFIFPVIRNRVAHGKIITKDIELNAWLLLLDLNSSCELMLSNDLLLNKTLLNIENAYKKKDVLSVIRLASIFDSGIDSFYSKPTQKVSKLKEFLPTILLDSSFPYSEINSENISEIRSNISILKKLGINDRECKLILNRIDQKNRISGENLEISFS